MRKGAGLYIATGWVKASNSVPFAMFLVDLFVSYSEEKSLIRRPEGLE